MADINVKRIPDDTLRAFKALCYARGTTMRDEIIKYMAETSKHSSLELVIAEREKAERGELFARV